MNATCVLEKKIQAVAAMDWPYRLYQWRPVSDFRLRKDSDFLEWLQCHTDLVTLLYWTLKSVLG